MLAAMVGWKSLVSKSCLFFGSIVLTVGLVEGLLRLLPGLLPEETQQLVQANPKNFGVSHPYIGHLHSPHGSRLISGRDFNAFHHTDGYGFRNTEPWPETADIVAVGDSLTFGLGVAEEQTWPAIIAQAMPQSHMINLGLIGAGPQQYLRVYETFGAKLHPKLLLVGLFLRNDFWDADMFDRWLRSGARGNYLVWRDFGRPQSVRGIKSTLRWKGYLLLRRSYLYNLLHEVWKDVKRQRLSEPKIFQFAEGTRLQLLPSDLASETVGAQPDRPEFQFVLQALQRIHSIATENGTHPLMVLQPSKEEVYLPLLGEAPPDPGGPLRQALDELGIEYLDLTAAFRRRAAAGEQLFFEVDGHPNARGYALIAELVLSHLKGSAERYALKNWASESSQAKP